MAGTAPGASATRQEGGAAPTTSQRRQIARHFVTAYPQARQVPAVPISSGFDRSVHLIGSSISVLKTWVPRGIPEGGALAVQPAVRTQNLKVLGDRTPFTWGGHFTNFSVVHPSGSGLGPAKNALSFFLDLCGFTPADVLVRASRAHRILFPAIDVFATKVRVEWDSRVPKYYTHTVGIPSVHGVNFNVALRHPETGEFDDVGNYIAFTGSKEGPAVAPFTEIGFGDTTILRAQLGLEHVLDAFAFPPPLVADRWADRHMQDAFLVSAVLWNEGLRPSSRDSRTKLLRKYLEVCRSIVTAAGLGRAQTRAWLHGLYEAEGFPPAHFTSLWSEHMESNLWT
ncbi:hypothetical protein [Streptomyces sp. NPDC059349]|uniref:hypothetical protein n=1 Tax=Streptomyces sp. NPDC059349 TaxID=3346808 RepID=UPI00368707F5